MPIFANEICEKYCEKQGKKLLDVLLDLVEMFCFGASGTSGSIHTFLHSAGVTVSWGPWPLWISIPLRLRAEAAH